MPTNQMPSLSTEFLNNSDGDAESRSLDLLQQLKDGIITVNDLMVCSIPHI